MKKKVLLFLVMVVSIALLLSSSVVSCAPAAPEKEEAPKQITLRLEHVTAHKPGDPPTVVAAEFARMIDVATNGRVIVKTYGEGEVHGNVQEMSVALMAGELDFALINFGDVAKAIGVPEYEIACRVPTLGLDWKTLLTCYDEFWNDPAGGGVVGKKFEAKGIRLLGTHTSGFVTMSASKKAPELIDWSGLKIRYPGGAVGEAMIKCLGATPVQIPWSEAQMALKTGVVNGIITDSAYFRYRLWELGSKYLAQNFVPLTYQRELAVSTKTLENLPEDVRLAILSMVPDFNKWCVEWNIVFTEKVVSDTKPFFEGYDLSPATLKTAAENLNGLMMPYFEGISPELLAVWEKTVDKYK